MQTILSFRKLITAVFYGAILGIATFSGCSSASAAESAQGLPRLLDIGSHSCIPCKLMAPVLDDLRRDYAGKLTVEFIDTELPENSQVAKQYNVDTIPTQIFYGADGKELWRHVGFIARSSILAKWTELGYSLPSGYPSIERWTPVQADIRAKDKICNICDGTIAPKTKVTIKTNKGDVYLCSLHCYFIMLSCLTEETTGIEQRVMATDWSTGKMTPAAQATYLYGLDAKSGRPTIKAFALRKSAEYEARKTGGNIVNWSMLEAKELAIRCGFCDRACYQEDAALVKADGLYTWGCCSHCALGVAARTGKNIDVFERDKLTGESIIVHVADGQIAGIEPKSAVAWFGQKKTAEGKFASAGCFHQGFFTTADHLRTWLDKNPMEIGKLISIDQALSDKMALTPVQISKACKIGECAPK
ncbi:MAG: organomercurial lyase [Armatimonadota bacterium]